ncbi:OmpA family protein [Candidatus Parabeggiatoa sp. HSG14]|uniref:OmpA family protein n=1 Tax=Candidatus Parabeggiatoa sp. HSG14 TaxID=3055593 RepID=UPI0025A84681|nr:OmpA family protein [Thiotrichales bacterium HSG14]
MEKLILLFLILTISPFVIASQLCKNVDNFIYQSDDLQNASITEQKHLIKLTLQRCPRHAYSHNNLAFLLKNEGNYLEAIEHYRQAVNINSNLSQAWYGLGEIYDKQAQFSLSLEAYLHVCHQDKSKKKIMALLENHRYATTEEGEVLEKENLLLLYDKEQRQEMEQQIFDCGLNAKIQPVIIFRNLIFNPGTAKLKKSATQQLNQIAIALKQIAPTVIKISSHTDNQPLQGVSEEVHSYHNLKLSKVRADTIKWGLVAHGIPAKHIHIYGYGSTKPQISENSQEAWAKNRRIEIAVE